MVRLYHYTSVLHWPLIQRDGFLKTTESNCSLRVPHKGPDVVWLTTDPDVTPERIWASMSETDEQVAGLHGLSPIKAGVRLTVDLPKRQVHKWLDWAPQHGLDAETRKLLVSAGGSGSWRVVPEPVPLSRVVEVLVRDQVPS